jgi:hypothetical protein
VTTVRYNLRESHPDYPMMCAHRTACDASQRLPFLFAKVGDEFHQIPELDVEHFVLNGTLYEQRLRGYPQLFQSAAPEIVYIRVVPIDNWFRKEDDKLVRIEDLAELPQAVKDQLDKETSIRRVMLLASCDRVAAEKLFVKE